MLQRCLCLALRTHRAELMRGKLFFVPIGVGGAEVPHPTRGAVPPSPEMGPCRALPGPEPARGAHFRAPRACLTPCTGPGPPLASLPPPPAGQGTGLAMDGCTLPSPLPSDDE